MREANINRVMKKMYESKYEQKQALNVIRNEIFKAFRGVSNGIMTEEQAIEEAWKTAKFALNDGKVTKEEIENIIAIALKNNTNGQENKTGLSR